MDQAEFESQLQAWKDLAISKQVLIGAVTEALGLDAKCDADALKAALDNIVKRAAGADASVQASRKETRDTVDDIQRKLKISEKAIADAQAAKVQAENALQAAEQRMQAGRADNAEKIKQVKKQLADEQKKLKNINTRLGDTPENTAKKLKTLKKQKTDEADQRKRAEETARVIRKEKKSLEQRLTALEATVKATAELAEKYRELHKISTEMHALLEQQDAAPKTPALEENLLNAIDEAVKNLDATK